MGFLDTKAKAAKLDQMNQAEYVNGKAAAQMAAELAAENEALKKGLAYNSNPAGYANVPGQEMGMDYRMPVAGAVGPSSYKRPTVVPQDQGLAAKIIQYLGAK